MGVGHFVERIISMEIGGYEVLDGSLEVYADGLESHGGEKRARWCGVRMS